MVWNGLWNGTQDRIGENSVETSTGTRRIRRLSVALEVQHLEDLTDEIKAKFNLIKELGKALKENGAEYILYFARERGEEELNNIGSETTTESISNVQDPELWKLLDEFHDVFRNELPNGLPPQRAVDHEINTGNEAPSNRNAYPLSIVLPATGAD